MFWKQECIEYIYNERFTHPFEISNWSLCRKLVWQTNFLYWHVRCMPHLDLIEASMHNTINMVDVLPKGLGHTYCIRMLRLREFGLQIQISRPFYTSLLLNNKIPNREWLLTRSIQWWWCRFRLTPGWWIDQRSQSRLCWWVGRLYNLRRCWTRSGCCWSWLW